MSNIFFIALFIKCFVLVHLERYDIFVIPVHIPYEENDVLQETNSNTRHMIGNLTKRLDIESYDNPTELPDIDNLSDTRDRSDYDAFNRKDDDQSFDDNGRVNNDDFKSLEDDKIVGGVEVEINIYPYHVAYGSNCGGAIIHNKWIITAGHCGVKPYIQVGSKYLKQGKKINVRRGVIHPMWSMKAKEHPFDYDFQLVELERPLKFDENSQPVKIAHIEDMIIGKVITVTGWGNTQENGPFSPVLRAIRVPIISKEHCQNVPFPYFRGSLTPRMFCAGYPDAKKDACQGDSGGPAVSQGRLLGMVSFGYGCATPGAFGVYSKVAKVRAWIEQTTGLKFD